MEMNTSKGAEGSYRSGLFLVVIFAAILLLASQSICQAESVLLQWDASTSTDVAGYKVYYQADSAAAPLSGTGATEGASPVDVATLTSATIAGLDPAHAYYFAVTAYNAAGVESGYSNIFSVPEHIPPSAAITSPTGNATASGVQSVSVSASDNVGVTLVEFYVNGVLQASDSSAPYLFSWNTSTLASGVYTLSAKAYDAAGNVGQSSAVSVKVVNDTTAPTVSLTAPSQSATVSGTVAITAAASDNVGVTRVEFYQNGALLSASNVAPYSYNWNTTSLANGSYLLNVKAYDAAGNVGQSANVSVTVFNDSVAPQLSINPVGASSTATSQTISGSVSDNDAVASVTVQVGSGAATAATVSGTSWSFQLTGLAIGTNLITVRATDRTGNPSQATTSIVVLAPVASGPAPLSIADAQLALQIASGLTTPSTADMARLDVAPYINGQSEPNGKVDTGDVVVILSKIVGTL